MPLMPKRVKYRKVQRGCRKGNATSCNTLAFGEYGIQSLGRAWITNIQIEACRVAVSRAMKRKGKLWVRIYPDKPYTKKPLEVRQGKGKGPVGRVNWPLCDLEQCCLSWMVFLKEWLAMRFVSRPARCQSQPGL